MKDFPFTHFMKMKLNDLVLIIEQKEAIEAIENVSLGNLTLKEVQDLAKYFFSISFILLLCGGFVWVVVEGVEFGIGKFVFDGMPTWTGELPYLVIWMGLGYFLLSKSHQIIFELGFALILQSISLHHLSLTKRIFVIVLIGVFVWLFQNFQYAGYLLLLGIVVPAWVTHGLYQDLLFKKSQGMNPSEVE